MTKTSLLAATSLLLGAPLLAACGSEAEAGDPPVVEVTESGSEPRRSFTLDVEEGHVESTTLVLSQSLSGSGQSVDVPEITMPFTQEVVGVTDDEVEVRLEYGVPTVADSGDPAQLSALRDALAPLGDLAATFTYGPHGELLDSDVEIPEGADQLTRDTLTQFTDQLDSLAVPFPDEEIGEGAEWTVTSVVEANGVEVEQEATYTLDSLSEDGRFEISTTVEQEFREGESNGFEITGGDGSTSGTLSGTVGLLAPTSSRAGGENTVEGESGGESVSVSTRTEMRLESEVG